MFSHEIIADGGVYVSCLLFLRLCSLDSFLRRYLLFLFSDRPTFQLIKITVQKKLFTFNTKIYNFLEKLRKT